MFLKKIIPLFLLFYYVPVKAQENKQKNDYSFIGLGYSYGKILPSLSIFPNSKQQQSFDLTYGITTYRGNNVWAKNLNYPKTGLLFSYSDFGNPKQLGVGLTLMPFLDCGVFNSFTNRVRFQAGLGGSYTTVIFDKITNPGNYGITTHITWAFRAFMYYNLTQTKDYAIKIGAGFTHFSNGHTRLPNQGLNSVLATINSELYFPKAQTPLFANGLAERNNDGDLQNYFSTRLGLGIRVLSRKYDVKNQVFTSSFSFGKIKNKTYKYGLGLYYRFYKDYYDYIKEDGQIINDKFPNFKKNPIQYSSAIGVFSNFEILMNHFSLEAELGINLYKPAYKMDWQLNDGLTYSQREFGVKDELKNVISSRLGLRYYVFNTKNSPLHNLFLAANINSNLGQADFSELSFGYVYSPKIEKQ